MFESFSVVWHRAMKLMQNCGCFINLYIKLLALSSATCEYYPKLLKLLETLQRTTACFYHFSIHWIRWQERHYTSFFSANFEAAKTSDGVPEHFVCFPVIGILFYTRYSHKIGFSTFYHTNSGLSHLSTPRMHPIPCIPCTLLSLLEEHFSLPVPTKITDNCQLIGKFRKPVWLISPCALVRGEVTPESLWQV